MTPRPNIRRIHLDPHESALTDDGKTFQQESDDSVHMLAYVLWFLIVGALGVIYYVVLS